MVTEELRKYVRECLASGKARDLVLRDLLSLGWQEAEIHEVLQGEMPDVTSSTRLAGLINTTSSFALPALVGIILVLVGTTLYPWNERLDLSNTNTQKVREFYTQLAQSQIAFTDAGEMVFPDEQEFLSQKAAYVQDKNSFIEADLRTMQITLYEKGVAGKTLEILTKGKEGSWWETPTGGCIRMSTKDAKVVFDFAKVGMPILVLEEKEEHKFGALTPNATDAILPPIGAKAFLVTDLSSGETILEKRAEEKFPIASLTKLMTAVVAHEVIYLGRS